MDKEKSLLQKDIVLLKLQILKYIKKQAEIFKTKKVELVFEKIINGRNIALEDLEKAIYELIKKEDKNIEFGSHAYIDPTINDSDMPSVKEKCIGYYIYFSDESKLDKLIKKYERIKDSLLDKTYFNLIWSKSVLKYGKKKYEPSDDINKKIIDYMYEFRDKIDDSGSTIEPAKTIDVNKLTVKILDLKDGFEVRNKKLKAKIDGINRCLKKKGIPYMFSIDGFNIKFVFADKIKEKLNKTE